MEKIYVYYVSCENKGEKHYHLISGTTFENAQMFYNLIAAAFYVKPKCWKVDYDLFVKNTYEFTDEVIEHSDLVQLADNELENLYEFIKLNYGIIGPVPENIPINEYIKRILYGEYGLTLETASKILKYEPATLSRKLNGSRKFTLQEIVNIFMLTNHSINELVKLGVIV